MKRLLAVAMSLGLVAAMAVPAMAGNVSGTAEDPDYPQLGEMKYLFNDPGYHFWFTAVENLGPYEAGHSYHNVYKYAPLEDASDWCGPVSIPDRLPYNAADTDGMQAYYKIWDVTDEQYVCGSE